MSMMFFSTVVAFSLIIVHYVHTQKIKAALKHKRVRVMTPEEEVHHRHAR